MIWRIITITFKVLRAIILCGYLGLLFIHFILKDRFFSLSTLYYACPLPLLIILGLIVTLLFLGRKRILVPLLILMLGLTIYFFSHYFGTANTPKEGVPITNIVFWNAAQNKPLPTDILIEKIQTYKPVAIGLVESLASPQDIGLLEKACPEYEFKKLYGTMLIGVKGTIDSISFKSKTSVYKFNYIKATINSKPFNMIIADVNAIPFSDKGIPLGTIHEFAIENNVSLIMGDFNTPYESVFFKPYKDDFLSFHPYSIGMSSTWPTPVPVIEIDHVWINKKLHPVKLLKVRYDISDHKMLIAQYQD